MPIIALPWLHSQCNSSEKNVLATLGDTEKEQHGETKVTAAFYKNSSVCCLSWRQPLSKCKTRSKLVKPDVHQTGTTAGLKEAQHTESWDVKNPLAKSLGNTSVGAWTSWILLNLRDHRRCWIKKGNSPLLHGGVLTCLSSL